MKPSLKFPSVYQKALQPVYNFSRKRKARLYLVGGILRDLLLGRKKENPDFDFCIRRGAISFGRALAKELKAGFVVLDKEHGACRVVHPALRRKRRSFAKGGVKKVNGKIYTFDFTDFRGPDLKEDLLHRDFTINAMALELKDALSKGNLDNLLIDLYGGRKDLREKKIRMAHRDSFREDPLRILRAFSFAAVLGFSVDKEALKAAKTQRGRLVKVSPERIRDELFRIFSCGNAYDCFTELDKSGILKVIFPQIEKMRGIGQGPYHHLDVWQHTLETLKQLEFLFGEAARKEEIREFLQEEISSGRSRFSLLKFTAFLHDIGKPATLRHEDGKTTFHGHERVGRRMAADIAAQLKLSNDEINVLKSIILCHLRPGYLADNPIITARAKFRFFRDAGGEAVSVLLLSIADQRATKGPLTTAATRKHHEKVAASLIGEHFRKRKEKKPQRLVNGHDLMRRFKLSPSPLIGKMLAHIEELQAIGRVRTKEEALRAAAKLKK